MKKAKNICIGITISIFIVPQIVLAAWWNPLSWSIWNIFRPTPHVQQVQIATTIPTTINTNTEKADTKVVFTQKPVVDSTQKVSQPNIKQPSVTVPSQPIPTPAPSCTQDTWSCSDWASCSSSGFQTRSCTKTSECSSVVTLSPNTSQSCTPPPPSCQVDNWSCGAWSSCSASGNQTRNCTKTFDCSSVDTPSPSIFQSCTPPVQVQQESTPTQPVLPTCTITPDVNFNDNQSVALHNSQTGTFKVAFDFEGDCWAEKLVVNDSVSSANGYVSFNQYFPFAKMDRLTGKPCYWLSKYWETNGVIDSRNGTGCSVSSPNKWYLNVEVSKDAPVGTKVGICVLSAEDGNSQPIKGLSYCTKTWPVE